MKKLDIGGEERVLCNDPKRPNMAPQVYLTNEQTAALGLQDVRGGDRLLLRANVTVTTVSSHEADGETEKSINVTLRLDEAEVVRPAATAADRLYGA